MLAGVPAAGLALATTAAATDVAYAAFQLVRRRSGEPSQPEIMVPDGYAFVAGEAYSVASRAEFYTFVTGPRADAGVPISVRWPDVLVEEVTVLRNGAPWLHIATRDRVSAGVLTLDIEHLCGPQPTVPDLYRYDPLTGVLI